MPAIVTLSPTSELAPTLLTDPDYANPSPNEQLQPDLARRERIDFFSDGIRIAGHLYRVPGAKLGQKFPGIVMCGPISSVKEMTLPHYAERLSAAGYVVLTFDPRSLGESDAAPGRPRNHYDPYEIIRDYQNGLSWLLSQADIDPHRVAAVGVCMGGGYTIALAARDKRIKAAASVAGGYDCGLYFASAFGIDGFAAYLAKINTLLQTEYESGQTAYVPTIANALDEATPIAAMPFPAAYRYYDTISRREAPNWPQSLTASSLLAWFGFVAQGHAPMVGPTPMLIVHGTQDIELPPESAVAVYNALSGPKQFVWIENHNHFEFYNQDPYVTKSVGAVLNWLQRHGVTP